MPQMQIRNKTGSAVVELIDSSRVTILPFSTVQFHETNSTTEIGRQYGCLIFQLPADTRVEISTTSARLAPVRQAAMTGDLFAQTRMAQAIERGAAAGAVNWGVIELSVGLFTAVNIVGVGSVSGAFGGGDPSPATPLQSIR